MSYHKKNLLNLFFFSDLLKDANSLIFWDVFTHWARWQTQGRLNSPIPLILGYGCFHTSCGLYLGTHEPCPKKEVGCCVSYKPKQTWLHTVSVEVGSLRDSQCWHLQSNKTGIAMKWAVASRRCTAANINKCLFFFFLLLVYCKPARYIPPPTVLDCVHMQGLCES